MPMNTSFTEQVLTPGGISPDELDRVQALYENILIQSDSHASMGRVPRTYAQALLDAAVANKQVLNVATDYHTLVYDLLPNVPGLEAFLQSPAVNRKAKDEFLTKLLEGKATNLFVDFLHILNNKDRLGLIRFIGIAFRTLLEEKSNRLRVLVESATALTDEQRHDIKKTLAEMLNVNPILTVRERPDLIGGLIIHVGDKVFDTSVRTKLQTIRNTLLARGTHEIQSRRDRFSNN